MYSALSTTCTVAMAKQLLLLLLFCVALVLCKAGGLSSASDAEALRAFAAEIDSDPSGVFNSWSSKDVCSWTGVDCTWIRREFRVTSLILPSHKLQGRISQKLSLLSELKHLDLSANRFTGEIPKDLALLSKLRSINLSQNQLYGQIPFDGIDRAVFKQAAAFAGNPGLCGSPLPKCSTGSTLSNLFPKLGFSRRLLQESPAPAPAPTQRSSSNTTDSAEAPGPATIVRVKHKSSKIKRWAIGAAIGVVVGSIAGVIVGALGRIGVIIYRNSRRVKGPIIFHHKINPKDLEFLDGPNVFQDSDKIGQGAAGKVYKATLQNGLTVAIKQIKFQQPEPTSGSSSASKSTTIGKRTSMAEIETLGKIRHVNLTWLYAYILKPDAHLLVYQFMPGGSLLDALKRVRDGSLNMNWATRRKIAIGMVTGIKYLHFDCIPKILHRDLKPSNILLDEDMEAHLGDFGLAKALPEDVTHVTTNVAGTIGYIAPEYNQTLKVTAASDVYSLGVVLGVLLIGREPTDHDFFKEASLVQYMCFLVQTGQELRGIDPKLLEQEGGAGASVEDIAEMKLAMRIACLCTKTTAAERPTSKDVLVMLNPANKVEFRPMTELIQENDM